MGSLAHKRICVTGGSGFLGSVVCAKLREHRAEVFVPRHPSMDLPFKPIDELVEYGFDITCQSQVTDLFERSKPEIVIHLAAEVGGIGANQKQPGRFFYANMAMGLNLIEEARKRGVEKFVQIGTVCSYPEYCSMPFYENDLWSGYPEPTNAPYGVAKRALGVMLDAYRREYGFNGIYLIPANLYGPGDNFDPETSHVIPALIRKFCMAVEEGRDAVVCWGTGRASREFLYVDDAAEAIVTATAVHNRSQPINLGTAVDQYGHEITILQLAVMVARVCGYNGAIHWDASQPDGQQRRQVDTRRAIEQLNWRAETSLEEGLRRTIDWWKANKSAKTMRESRGG